MGFNGFTVRVKRWFPFRTQKVPQTPLILLAFIAHRRHRKKLCAPARFWRTHRRGLLAALRRPVGYFPYVAQCRHHWVAVAASNPVPGDDPDGIALIGQWFHCEDTKGYLPYVGSCPHVWLTIPAVPPPNVQSASKTKTAT